LYFSAGLVGSFIASSVDRKLFHVSLLFFSCLLGRKLLLFQQFLLRRAPLQLLLMLLFQRLLLTTLHATLCHGCILGELSKHAASIVSLVAFLAPHVITARYLVAC